MVVAVQKTVESSLMNTERFIESMRVLCADEERLRELRLRIPSNELVPAILATTWSPASWWFRAEQPTARAL